jgi:CheY-like chemotaxis protein
MGPELPALVTTDPGRLRQILINVVGNAIKFTDRGEVELAVASRETAAASGRHLITFRVRDTGPGITAEQQSRLFRPFAQADVSTTRRYGGTGLGLVLSRRLARLMGGDLVLEESIPGVGSTFVVTVEVEAVADDAVLWMTGKPAAAAANAKDGTPSLAGARILVAEDSPDVQLLMKTILMVRGAEVEVAGNGLEAVEMAFAGDYDLVLMDVQMPVMDGLDATRALRKQGFAKPIVALTAHAMKEERDRCFEAGCDGHLPKPSSHATIYETITSLLGKRHQPDTVTYMRKPAAHASTLIQNGS